MAAERLLTARGSLGAAPAGYHAAMRTSLLPVLALSLAACDPPPGTDAGVTDAPTDAPVDNPYAPACEGLDPAACLLPWPSSRYLAEDPSTATGLRVDLPVEAMPTNFRRVPVDPSAFGRFDGFSPMSSVITVLPEGTDYTVFADERHIEDSLAADSHTVLLEVAADGTTTRVAHFAEPDTWPDALPSERPFYIRPAARLREGTRYVVAIRNLVDEAGAGIDAQPYFRALRDETPFPEAADLEGRRAHFEELFGLLDDAGVPRSELFLAWDFVTATGETIWGDMIAMRDQAHEALDADGTSCTIDEVQEAPDEHIARRIYGTVRVPLFLNGVDPASPDESRVSRGSDGEPRQNGFADVPFTASIPRSVVDGLAAGTGEPARLLTYGHGLFGSRGETESGWFRETIDELGMVGIAVDWWGMSSDDVVRVTGTLTEMSSFDATGERLMQSLVNFEVLTRSMRERCFGDADPENPFYVVPTSGGEPTLSFDPAQRYYYGNSQGGIMGTSLAGISLEIERFNLGVGGMSYAVMIPRSSNWQTYGAIMRNGYRRQLFRALLMQMVQSLWDLSEPATYAPHILTDTLPCSLDGARCPEGRTPTHHVLYQIGVDDDQVANITADIAARTIGLPVLTPSPYLPYGMPEVTSSVPDALVIYAIPGTPVLPIGTRDPGSAPNPAHEGPRRSAAARAQIDAFCRPDGLVTVTCDGVCDPD